MVRKYLDEEWHDVTTHVDFDPARGRILLRVEEVRLGDVAAFNPKLVAELREKFGAGAADKMLDAALATLRKEIFTAWCVANLFNSETIY